jgi:nitronate monooxygenase
MWSETALTGLLGVRLPLVVAPMGGGPTTPELVAAAASAGALGTLASGYLDPGAGRAAVRRVRELTDSPFAVNLFVSPPVAWGPAAERTAARLAPYYEELGVALPEPADRYGEDLEAQLEVVLDEQVPVLSFTFGIPDADLLDAVRGARIVTVGTATSVTEALALVDAGVDAVCAQGAEAGAHRGSFTAEGQAAEVGTFALVPQVADAVDVPVIAAGGVMDGRGIAAALALGADGVQMGTAFLRCPEAGTNAAHREALRRAGDVGTAITRAFTGKPARGIRNRFLEEMDGEDVAPYPVTHALTGPLRREAARVGSADHLALWAGQAAALGREMPAAELLAVLEEETARAMERWR